MVRGSIFVTAIRKPPAWFIFSCGRIYYSPGQNLHRPGQKIIPMKGEKAGRYEMTAPEIRRSCPSRVLIFRKINFKIQIKPVFER